jgi:cardiolipin synthase
MVVTLGMQSLIPTPLATVIVVRDVLLVAGGFAYRALTKPPGDRFFETTTSGSFEVKPEMISKINTVGQLSLIGFTLTNAAYQIPAAPFIEVLGYGVAVTTVWSGVRYIFIGKAFQNLSKDDKDIWSNTKDKLNKKL